MKALLLTAPKKLEIQDVPIPDIGPMDVLVRVKTCGICGSDVHGYDGSSGRRIPPLIMGHEAAGVIERTGPEVRDWQAGDRVTFDSTIYCGRCTFCRRGQINLCNNRRVLGVSCDEYRQHGAFAEYVAVPQRILYRLPDAVSFEQAALVEPLSIAFHAVGLTPIELNDSVLVIGAGMIGLLIIQTLALRGAGKIIAVDISDEKLALAKNLGANAVINNRDLDAYHQALENLVGPGGVDAAIEAVGLPQTVQLAAASLRKGGALTLVGNISPTAEIPLQKIVTRQISLQGSCASNGEYPACLEMIGQGRINVDAMIHTARPLEEGSEWFDRLHQQDDENIMKVLLVP